jgi:hypothetical protein
MKSKKKTMRPAHYAKLKKVSPQVVNNWINRGKLETVYDAELKLRLVVTEAA